MAWGTRFFARPLRLSCGRHLICLPAHVQVVKQHKPFVEVSTHLGETLRWKGTVAYDSGDDDRSVSTLLTDICSLGRMDASRQTDGAWEVLETRALNIYPTLRGSELPKLLYSFTLARRRPKKLLARLTEEIPERLPQLDTAALCVCLHAYAQMRSRESRLFTTATRHILNSNEPLALPHLSSLLYSHARVLVSHPALLKIARNRLSRNVKEFGAEDLATSLQALATLGVRDPKMAVSCATAAYTHIREDTSHLPKFSLYSDLLTALVRLEAPCEKLQRVIADLCTDHSSSLAEMPLESLMKLLQGLGSLESTEAARLVIIDIVGRRLDELTGPKLLMQAFEQFADLYPSIDQARMADLCAQVTSQIINLGVKDLSVLARACQRSGVRDVALLEALARQALRKGPGAMQRTPEPYQKLLDALESLGFAHSAVKDLREALMTAQASGGSAQRTS
eukprot:TRINITY_DN16560_c1_g1_i1.p1 TRINITY_DN16560_c1_g1~~TRINITY_DN16560_c1_g1_i1.p1  ORF type:complete len:474 (+),score=46.18 TRINITY_DN16560_c1_g1_i1:66-1424(+)